MGCCEHADLLSGLVRSGEFFLPNEWLQGH